ncbi:MAG: hypothetical protein HOB64_04575 [Rhodospirillaceae bacterium]|jgi:hypothetical protein|nr:hypothetical protein [Rhodospirillaceae bacterium]
MDEERPYITITLEFERPVEVGDFTDFFTGFADQFQQYLGSAHPEASKDAKIYIKEVRKGSIVADLFPNGPSDLIQFVGDAAVVIGFASAFGKALLGYVEGRRNQNAKKSDLKEYLETVRSIANDTDGKATIETTHFKEGVLTREVAFSLDTSQARAAITEIENHQTELEKTESADHSRVLMTFTRSDIGDVSVGKSSGERVMIEEISPKALPLIYASELAEGQIKHEIRDTDENIYHKGFVVDVYVATRNGKPVAYKVTTVHQVVDLSQD